MKIGSSSKLRPMINTYTLRGTVSIIMRKQIYLIALFVICSTIIGCNNQNKQALNIIDADFLRLDTLIRLHNWHILAPFYSDSNISTLDIIQQDLLLDFHSDERNIIDINIFIEIGKDISSENSNITLANVHIPYQIMDSEKVFEIEPPMTDYLAYNIESTEGCMAALNVSAYLSAKFWLNGVEIYNIEWKRGRNSFR